MQRPLDLIYQYLKCIIILKHTAVAKLQRMGLFAMYLKFVRSFTRKQNKNILKKENV